MILSIPKRQVEDDYEWSEPNRSKFMMARVE